jgi:hypothetical protein
MLLLLAATTTSLFACRATRPAGPPLDASPSATAADMPWLLTRLLHWTAAPCGAGQSCDTESGLRNRTAIRPDEPLYRTHVHRFSRGCGLSGEKPPDRPRGRLVSWDIDGDGAQELVFAGGCSPEPYFVILTGGRDGFSVWREFSARLLGIEMRDGRLVLAASREGYGVERDRGLVLWNCPPRDPLSCVEMVFRWSGELSSNLLEGDIRACHVVRDAALRTSPAVDDEPEESGMGYDWPGNLYQTMAAGSESWALGEIRDGEGRTWSLLAVEAPPATDDVVDSMLRPFLARQPGRVPAGGRVEWILGWMRKDALRCASAVSP